MPPHQLILIFVSSSFITHNILTWQKAKLGEFDCDLAIKLKRYPCACASVSGYHWLLQSKVNSDSRLVDLY